MGIPDRHPEHRHTPVSVRAVSRRAGVPYEITRFTCSGCGRVLAEHVLRRATA